VHKQNRQPETAASQRWGFLGGVGIAKRWRLYIFRPRRYAPLAALRWRWHKLLLNDRNSSVIIYVVKLRLVFYTSSFPRFPVCVFHPLHGAGFTSLAFSVIAFSAPPIIGVKSGLTLIFWHCDMSLHLAQENPDVYDFQIVRKKRIMLLQVNWHFSYKKLSYRLLIWCDCLRDTKKCSEIWKCEDCLKHTQLYSPFEKAAQ